MVIEKSSVNMARMWLKGNPSFDSCISVLLIFLLLFSVVTFVTLRHPFDYPVIVLDW